MKSKYKVVRFLLFHFSVIMIVMTVIYSINDYQIYIQHPEYSAPFYVYLIAGRFGYFISIIAGSVLFFLLTKRANRFNGVKK